MKNRLKSLKVIALIMSVIMLANCTVYRSVQKPPDNIRSGYHTRLIKQELEFWLDDAYVVGDTLCGTLSYQQGDQVPDPVKSKKMDVYLKPETNLVQDSQGVLRVPFSAVSHIEYYVKDEDESRRKTIIAVSLSIAGGVAVVGIMCIAAMASILNGLADQLGN